MKSSTGGYCPLCGKVQTQFARHLTTRHYNIKNIKIISTKKKRDKTRRNSIYSYRLKGLNMFNSKYNLTIPVRHRSQSFKLDSKTQCHNCHNWFSKKRVKLHEKKCRIKF